MLLACQLLCESAEQQAQRFITTTGKEKKNLLFLLFLQGEAVMESINTGRQLEHQK